MAQTKIEWTATELPGGGLLPGFTHNPWVGCTRVSPGCDHCYAEGWAKRTGQPGLWGAGPRRTTDLNWRKPLAWDRSAKADGIRRKVFCASLADVFDNQVPDAWRDDLWRLIAQTPNLDWLLLTKRPQNIQRMLPNPSMPAWPWPNVWLGTSVENQTEADRRIPHLLSIPAVVRFLSVEPMLSWVDLKNIQRVDRHEVCALTGHDFDQGVDGERIHWVIVGGESGPNARHMDLAWARRVRDQCKEAHVPFFMKQVTGKGEIPADLMIRQFPAASLQQAA